MDPETADPPQIVAAIKMALFVVLVAGGMFAFWKLRVAMDRARIVDDLARRGYRVLSLRRAGFWEGGLTTDRNRLFKVRYLDAAGQEHVATCKTSLGNGVYFKLDEVVQFTSPPPLPPVVTALELENQRLRAELARLRHHRA
ncbi:MAG TPA: hypothetical protein VGO11_09340 [Chthoniobacteraceae bacterium]|jgi:hypothetical protein|nr:hypothetical protein [Chthoniobacteraceae bacterium]